jgi:serine/threonine protein phosphatase PrpC
MTKNFLLYHENNLEKPFIPQEDAYASNNEDIFVVADGITHDLVNGTYPNPSDAGKVAQIIVDTILGELTKSNKEIEDIKKALNCANDKVLEFNHSRSLYLDKENNGYTIGAAVLAVIILKKDRLIYGVLDDCYFSIFSDDLVDHPTLNSFVDKSAKYFDANFDWSKSEDRKVWRKDIRNHLQLINGQEIGYGALDGRKGFEQFVQYGEEILKPNDLICLYTDGFIKILRDLDFVKKLKESDFSLNTFEYISNYTKTNGISKEKTCYFIKN